MRRRSRRRSSATPPRSQRSRRNGGTCGGAAPAATPFQSPAWLIPWWRHFHPGRAPRRRGPARTAGSSASRRSTWRTAPSAAASCRSASPSATTSTCCSIPASGARPGRRSSSASARASGALGRVEPGGAARPAPPRLALPAPPGCEEQLAPAERLPGSRPARRARPDFDAVAPAEEAAQAPRSRATGRHGAAASSIERARPRPRPPSSTPLPPARRRAGRAAARRACWPTIGSRPSTATAAPGLMQAGLLRLYVLRIGGEPAAAYYGFVHRERAYAYLTASIPASPSRAPARPSARMPSSKAIAEGAREFHFLRGREAYKYGWGAVDRWNMRRSFRRGAERPPCLTLRSRVAARGFRPALQAAAAGLRLAATVPPNIALMQLLMDARSPAKRSDAHRGSAGSSPTEPHALEARRLQAALACSAAQPAGLANREGGARTT